MAKAGEYNLRITVLARVLAAPGANNEEAESWPGPGNDYFAKRLVLSAGETISQGVREGTGGMKIAIRGRAIEVQAYDRVQKKATGELYAVTGVSREAEDTVLTCERVRPQAVGQ